MNTAWFGGHHVPAYSVLFPPLGSLLGERIVGALAAVGACAAFGGLAGARLGVAFVPGVLAALVSGRITFLLGAAFAVAAVWAANPRPRSEQDQASFGGWSRVAGVAGLGLLTALASPVAALFAGLAGVALRSRPGVVLAVAVAVPTVALAWAFGEGGTFPFAFSAFLPAFAAGVAVAVVAPRGSPLAVGGALYAALCLAVLVVPTPVGGNATRLGVLLAAPVAVHLLWPHRRKALGLLALPLAYWIVQPAVRDVVRTRDDPSVEAAFHAPLIDRIDRIRTPARVEVPLTANKAEANHLARHVPIARGWERQLDRRRHALFYEGELTPDRYERWLVANGVTHVALPKGVRFDGAGDDEARLVASAPPFLRELPRAGAWRLFVVRGVRDLGVSALGRGSSTAPRAGEAKVRWSRFWTVTAGNGCVEPAPGGWTRVTGPVTVGARLSLEALRSANRRCR